MTIDFSKHEFVTGSGALLEEGWVYPAAGITASVGGYTDIWLDRIQCHGKTEEEAQALRDRVLKGLEMVAEQEREDEMSRRSFEKMKERGLIVVGTANIGSQVISAGLGGKDD